VTARELNLRGSRSSIRTASATAGLELLAEELRAAPAGMRS
jgi:hypothetical protein